MHYRFVHEPPDLGATSERFGFAATTSHGPMLPSVDADAQPLSDGAPARAFAAYPLLTLKVVAGIHWEAARLLLKRLQVHRKPPPPTRSVTVIRNPRT